MVFHKKIGDGPIKVVAIHGWFGDHRAFETMYADLDVKRFSYAFPFNVQSGTTRLYGDNVERFQFSIGGAF